MLLIASETFRASGALNNIVREMSFTPSLFASPGTFAELMLGESRRIVLLGESDIVPENIGTLDDAKDRKPPLSGPALQDLRCPSRVEAV